MGVGRGRERRKTQDFKKQEEEEEVAGSLAGEE
jgi:hypothetical protein